MNNTEHNFIQKLKEIRLGDGVRTRIREELVAYSELHTMPMVEATPFNSLAFLGSVLAHSRKLAVGVVVFALIVATGSATAIAAENAVPGEALYPVKVQITEPARVVLAGSGEAKAKLHASLAVRRVQEAEILRTRGRLTKETESELTARFSAEAEKAEVEADKLEVSGDTSESLAIRENLATALSEQTAVALDEHVARVSVNTLSKTEEVPADVSNETSIRGAVATRVALLRVREAQNTKKVAEQEKPKTAAKEQSKKSKALLVGVSVAQEEQKGKTASTTASTTPTDSKGFLERLFRPSTQKAETREPVRESLPVSVPVPALPVSVPPASSLLP